MSNLNTFASPEASGFDELLPGQDHGGARQVVIFVDEFEKWGKKQDAPAPDEGDTTIMQLFAGLDKLASAGRETSSQDGAQGTKLTISPRSSILPITFFSAPDTKDSAKKGPWRELRAFAEGDRNFKLTLKRVEGKSGLFGSFKGVSCFLPSSELPKEFNINSVTTDGSKQWVKIVSMSRSKRSVIVSMRLNMAREELQKAASERQAQTAERKNRKERRAAAAAQAKQDFEWLTVGQEVHGTVVDIFNRTGNDGKALVTYFVKVGTQLVGALREHQVPFEKGTRQPRILKVGDRVLVRITSKFTTTNRKTGAQVPKVDLSMRHPQGEPRVWTFGAANAAPGEILSKALKEKQRLGKGKGKGKGGKTHLHKSASTISGDTALGDALKAALTARR